MAVAVNQDLGWSRAQGKIELGGEFFKQDAGLGDLVRFDLLLAA